tara:strand:- start:405 stop:911 length:507 start_codon:yes stop_codon:yes gene_type:complete
MRIKIKNQSDELMSGPGDVYAKEISTAGAAFSYAIYEHSKLPLRVFEAGRLATAMINGCEICKNWQSKRDIKQMGIKGGVIENGDAPDDQFYQDLLNNDLSNLNHQERLAFQYAQAMGNEPKKLAQDDKFWDELKKVFSDGEITDLTYCIAGWMGMGRVAHVLGLDRS